MIEDNKNLSENRTDMAFASLCLLLFLVTAGTFAALGAVLPDMVKALGWSWSGAGLGYSLLGLSCGLSSYVPAIFVRRLGVVWTLNLGGWVLFAGFYCLSATHSLGSFWLGTVFLGLGFTLTAIIPGTFVITHLQTQAGNPENPGRPERQSRRIGYYYAIGGAGGVLGPLLYPLVQALGLDWRGFWISLGIAVLCSGFWATASLSRFFASQNGPDKALMRSLRPANDTAKDLGLSVGEALKTWGFWVIAISYSLYLLCETSLNSLAVGHFLNQGFPRVTALLLLSFQALCNSFARAYAGRLAEKYNPKTLAIVAMVAMGSGLLGLGFEINVWVAALMMILIGFGYGTSLLAISLLLLKVFGKRKNLELFSIVCLMSTVAAIGPWLGGFIKDASGAFRLSFVFLSALALLGMFLLISLKPSPVFEQKDQTLV